MSNVKVCETIQEVNEHIKRFELLTCSKYIVNKIDKGYSIPRDLWKPPLTRMRVFWEWTKRKDTPLIPFDGVPFMFVGCKILGCHRGKDKHARRKQQYAEQREREDQEGLSEGKRGRRHHLIKTKKLSCPAVIGVTRIAKFPEYKLQNEERDRDRKTVSCMLRDALETDPGSVQRKDLYVIKLPDVSDHSSHPVAEGEEEVDNRVQALIKEKVKDGVTRVADIKEHMVHFVHTALFPDSPPPEVRAFFPKEKTIRSIMKKARNEIHFSRIDLANLLTLAEDWKQQAPRNNFLLRIQSESENLLLCYQTDWQRDLLRLYGREVCFLDAAYRRSHFPLPLYFLCVRTSFGLVATGLFVVQTKSEEALAEALEVFRQWSPTWTPSYILTEDCPQEMVAVETVFAGCQAVLNDYLREKTWTQWLCNGNRTIVNHTEVLEMMCAVAGALTEEEHQVALHRLQESSIWTRPLFRNWFTNKWLSEEKRWANAVRADVVNFVSQMDGGVELQRQFFTHKSLREHKDKNLSAMLQVLVDQYLPQMLGRYKDLKRETADLVLHPSTPSFLRRRPKAVAACVTASLQVVTSSGARVVTLGKEGTFRVQEEEEEEEEGGQGHAHTLSFGTASRMPFCECAAWRSQRLPCRHFCHVFAGVPGWGWERLCPRYSNHPLLSADVPAETGDDHAQIAEPPQRSSAPGTIPPLESPPHTVAGHPIIPAQLRSQATTRDKTAPRGPVAPPTPPRGPSVRPLTESAQSAVRLLCLRDELRRRCGDTLAAVAADVARVQDVERLRELRRRLDELRTETSDMLPHGHASSPPAKKRKQGGVDIIVAMPKCTRVPATLPAHTPEPPQA